MYSNSIANQFGHVYLLELVERLLKADSLEKAIATVGSYLKFAVPISDLLLVLQVNEDHYQLFRPLESQSRSSEVFNIDFESLSELFQPHKKSSIDVEELHPSLRDLTEKTKDWQRFNIGLSRDSLGFAVMHTPGKLDPLDEQFVRGVCEHLALTIIRFAQIRNLEEVTEHVFSVNKELKLRQARLQTSNRELSRTLDELHQAQDALTEVRTQASLGKLVRGVAHKINSPTGVCLTASSALESICSELKQSAQTKTLTQSQFDSKLDSMRDLADLLQRNCCRISHLVSTFKLASVEEWVEKITTFDLTNVIQNGIHHAYRALEKRPVIEVKNRVTHDLVGYPNVLAEALGNLIINAIQYGCPTEHSRVWINAYADEEFIQIEINDEGFGIEPFQWNNFFEPFVTSSTQEHNLGLGAHISYNLITQKYGGQLRLVSEPNQPTHLLITLPANLERIN